MDWQTKVAFSCHIFLHTFILRFCREFTSEVHTMHFEATFDARSEHSSKFQKNYEVESGTGDEQSLVIWTANCMDLNEIGSQLDAISEPLPYE